MWQAKRDQDAHSVFAVPRFVYPKAGNWRLMPLSPGTEIEAGPVKPPAGTDPMAPN